MWQPMAKRGAERAPAPNPHAPANPGPGAPPAGSLPWLRPPGQAALAAPQPLRGSPTPTGLCRLSRPPSQGCGAHARTGVLWFSETPRLTEAPSLRQLRPPFPTELLPLREGLSGTKGLHAPGAPLRGEQVLRPNEHEDCHGTSAEREGRPAPHGPTVDRKSTRLNSSH